MSILLLQFQCTAVDNKKFSTPSKTVPAMEFYLYKKEMVTFQYVIKCIDLQNMKTLPYKKNKYIQLKTPQSNNMHVCTCHTIHLYIIHSEYYTHTYNHTYIPINRHIILNRTKRG